MDVQMMIVGFAVMAVGILLVVIAAITRGEPHEYVWGLIWSEMGAMFAVNGMFPSSPARIGVSVFFVLAIGWSFFMWWKLWREFKRTHPRPDDGREPVPRTAPPQKGGRPT